MKTIEVTQMNSTRTGRPVANQFIIYTNKNVYGGDGKHYRNEPVLPNLNRTKMTKF